ncbi:hypothetical protein SAMN05216358_3722 [Rhizobium sp. AN5]|uniref:hypothetical protein n=1 Tax=Rhizobium sp. AN5 TaxID=1855304 RepID=UPI000BDAA686|nr:hypothetical protein [Rhizobium sp. AN5]SOC93543.1 hypothetical protein SAMN05216358_3722 [Rhizobium sp. AN5]
MAVSLTTFAAAYFGALVAPLFLAKKVVDFNAADYWLIWPVNLYYISQIEAHFGSLNGWNTFLLSNYIASSLMICRLVALLVLELNRPKHTFNWGVSGVYAMIIPLVLIGLLLPFGEGRRSRALTFYDGPFGSSMKTTLILSFFYFSITDPLVKFISWIKFTVFSRQEPEIS